MYMSVINALLSPYCFKPSNRNLGIAITSIKLSSKIPKQFNFIGHRICLLFVLPFILIKLIKYLC